jgi:hypothetical protein
MTMHPTDDLRIALYRGPSFETLGLDEYLGLTDAERRALPDPAVHVTLHIMIDGLERFHARGLGPLDRLVAQLEPARLRIAAGAPALIRGGVLDVPDGRYFLFEPIDETAVRVSMFTFDDLPESGWFPDDKRAEGLYRFVAHHRDRLVATARAAWPELVEIAMDRPRLDAALAREAAAGNRIVGGQARDPSR